MPPAGSIIVLKPELLYLYGSLLEPWWILFFLIAPQRKSLLENKRKAVLVDMGLLFLIRFLWQEECLPGVSLTMVLEYKVSNYAGNSHHTVSLIPVGYTHGLVL